jgi:Cu-Zn family superoxide dismutase
MRSFSITTGLTFLIFILTGCAAVSRLGPIDVVSKTPNGRISFYQDGAYLKTRVALSGLIPGATYGLHIHEIGDCRDPLGGSAGNHYNPLNKKHGGLNGLVRHLGDLGNVEADASGNINRQLKVAKITLNGQYSVLGLAIILKSGPDDLTTDPNGKSGNPIACGLIGKKTIMQLE